MNDLKQEIYNMQIETKNKIKQIRIEQNEKEQKVLKMFSEKFKDVIIKKNHIYYKGIEAGAEDYHTFKAYQILNTDGEINKKDYNTAITIWGSQLEKDYEIVNIEDMKDNAFNFENKTLLDLKIYLENSQANIKKVLTDIDGSFLHFDFDLVEGNLIVLKIIKGLRLYEGNKFSTFYNLVKRVGYNEYKIKKVIYGYKERDAIEIYKINCNNRFHEIRFFNKKG